MSSALSTHLATPEQQRAVQDYILDRAAHNRGTSCWEWQSARNRKGYGTVRVGPNRRGPTQLAHRVSYAVFCGPIPDGMYVCHHCDNPRCIKPPHLFLGDQVRNMADMKAKGRANCLRGDRSKFAKLAEADVHEIRRLYLANVRNVDIARKYRITANAVRMIATGKAWAHVPGAVPPRRKTSRVYGKTDKDKAGRT